MSSSNGRGTASDAVADTQPRDLRDLATYHEVAAEEAEAAVKNVRQAIKDLERSLKDREAEAKNHRAAAKKARADQPTEG